MNPPIPEPAETPERPSLGMRAASGALWITVEMATVQGLSLIVFSVLAHLLKPRDFGLIGISFVFVYSLKSITIEQVVTPVMRKLNASDLDYTTAFWMNAAFGVSTVLLLCLFSFVADRLFHTPGLGAVMRPMSLILIALALSRTQEAWLSRHFRFRVLAVRSILGMFLGGIAGITSALLGLGVWSLVIQQSVASFSALAMLWMTTPWRPGFQFSGKAATEILMFMRGISGQAFLYIFNQNADTAIIAAFFGPASAGFYTVAKRLKLALQSVAANPVTGVALPALSEAQDDAARQRRVFLIATRLVFTCCAPVFCGAAAVAAPAIVLMFGARWAGATSSFAWLSVGGLCSLAADYFGSVLLLRNRPAWLTWLAALQTVLSLVLFVLLRVAGTGQQMIAAPFVLPYLVIVPVCAGLAIKLLDIRVMQLITAVGAPLLATLIMSLFIHLLSPLLGSQSVIARLLTLCVSGALIYGLCVIVLARDTVMFGVKFLRQRRSRG